MNMTTTDLFEQLGIAQRLCDEGEIGKSAVTECLKVLNWSRGKGQGAVKFASRKMCELCNGIAA